jgi:hypothetical protein
MSTAAILLAGPFWRGETCPDDELAGGSIGGEGYAER